MLANTPRANAMTSRGAGVSISRCPPCGNYRGGVDHTIAHWRWECSSCLAASPWWDAGGPGSVPSPVAPCRRPVERYESPGSQPALQSFEQSLSESAMAPFVDLFRELLPLRGREYHGAAPGS